MVLAKNEADIKELPKWKKIQESGTEITLKRFIGKEEVVSKNELIELWGKSAKTIQRSVKDGMPVHFASSNRFQIFTLEKVNRWRDGNIDKTMSMKTSFSTTVNGLEVLMPNSKDGEDIKLKTDIERKLKADADNAVLNVQLNELKLAEAEGRVVDAGDLDRSMSELAVVHKTDKIHDENLLPILLENKSVEEIKSLLQEHNFERLEMLDKIVNKEFKSAETMYDIIEAVLHKLKSGTEPESIIKRINGSLV